MLGGICYNTYMRNPENLEAPNASERRPRSDRTRISRALGATAIKGANNKTGTITRVK